MALPVQVQHIPLSGGMNEKTPREMLPPDQLSYVRNGRWLQPGMVETRQGYTTLPTDVLGGGTIPTSFYDRLLVRDGELCRLNERGIYSYCPETSKWALRDRVPELHLYYDRRISGYANNNIIFTDMAVRTNGVFCVVWQDSGVHAAVFGANGQLLRRARLGDGLRPKVVSVGSKFVIVAGSSAASELLAWTVDATDPTAFSGSTVICADIQGTPPANWDIAACPSYFVVIYQNDAGDCSVRRFNSALSNTNSAASFVGTNVLVVAAYIDPNEADVYLAWHQVAGNRTDATRLNATLTAATWTATAMAGATNDQLTIGAASSSSNIWIAREGASGCEWVARAKSNGVLVGAALHTTHNVRLASKIFVSPDATAEAFICVYCAVGENEQQGLLCCALGTGNEAQSDYRLRPVAKWLTGKVYKNPDAGFELNHLPQVASRASSAGTLFYVAHPELDQGLTSRGAHLGVTRFDMAADNRWIRLEDRNTALVAGAMLHQYDGDQLTEIPFAYYPYFTISAPADAASTLPTGSYDYIVVYEWTDARGRVHRSVPSLPKSVSVTVNTTKAQLSIRNLTVTARSDIDTSFRSPLALAVYRRGPGAGAADPYVRLGSVTAGSSGQVLTLNDPLTSTTTFNDTGSGAWTTVGQPKLYTDGGVLEAAPPSSCRVLARWDNRIILGGCENARAIWYSRELVEDEPPLFHENQQIMCEEDVTALASFDSALIVFSKNAVWAMQGRGPNDLGQGSTYTGLIKLPAEVGCEDHRTLCITEEGVFFQSRPNGGLYLLDRSLSLSYIGAPVETHATYYYPITTSAIAVPEGDEIRFSVQSADGLTGRLLVYNTLVKQWMVHQLYSSLELNPRDAVMWNGSYVFCKDQRVAQQSALYQDYDTAAGQTRSIVLELITGDIALSGPLAVGRSWRAVFLGSYFSGSHGIEVRIAYDQAVTYADTKTWSATEVAGWASLPREIFEVVAKSRQEARSIRLALKTVTAGTEKGAAGFMALALEHGTEEGVARLPEAQRK